MALDRSVVTAWVDDDGSNTVGKLISKTDFVTGLLDPVDAEIARLDAARLAIAPASGQIAFPATQNPSAGANVLDDYEEGTFTPVLTFSTPGNLAVTYSSQSGAYTKVGREVTLHVLIHTTLFTHTTASGPLQITGCPFTPNGSYEHLGSLSYQGITAATAPHIVPRFNGATTTMRFIASGSGVGRGEIDATNVPTGGTVQLAITMHLFV